MRSDCISSCSLLIILLCVRSQDTILLFRQLGGEPIAEIFAICTARAEQIPL